MTDLPKKNHGLTDAQRVAFKEKLAQLLDDYQVDICADHEHLYAEASVSISDAYGVDIINSTTIDSSALREAS